MTHRCSAPVVSRDRNVRSSRSLRTGLPMTGVKVRSAPSRSSPDRRGPRQVSRHGAPPRRRRSEPSAERLNRFSATRTSDPPLAAPNSSGRTCVMNCASTRPPS
jgi:hypothetical protein